MNNIKIGFIGTGGMAQMHAIELLKMKHVEIAALADVSYQAMEHFSSKFHLQKVQKFSDYRLMLERADLDAVIIVSPHTLHFQQATDALNKGLHVLIEKPMTCSSKEAEQLIETAEKTGAVMQVSYQRHFQPEFIYIRDAIAKGEIGNLTSITASLYQQWWNGRPNGSWRQDPKLSGGGFLMDSGSHIVDMLLWTTGLKPVEIKSHLSQQGAPVEIDTFTSILFEGGVVAGLNLVGCSPIWHETYAFCGDKGGIFYENNRITLHRSGKEPIVPELPEQTTTSDKSFIDTILGRHELKVPGEFALKVVEFSENVYRAAGYAP